MKALVEQKAREWTESLLHIGLKPMLLTGDVSLDDAQAVLSDADVILTTPEKFDSVTRSANTRQHLIKAFSLLLVDEVHFLAEESRGAALEAVICRMRHLSTTLKFKLRVVALSATLPNASDLAEWLDAKLLQFDNRYRQVPLTIHVVGYQDAWKEFLFDKVSRC
jgi:replicative superfamily II helicase